MFLSLYTYVKNGLYLDFHIVDMLKHHLPLADEIIVNEGYSTDGTYEAISNIDPKIRITRSHWEKPGNSYAWYVKHKNNARLQCRGEWCLHLDADEFIPEWEFEELRDFLRHCDDTLVPLRVVDFYGNYKVHIPEPLCWRKMNLHRNNPEVEFWGDGANVKLKNRKFDWGEQPLRFSCHHFGSVRYPARLREKWHVQGRMYGKGKRYKLPSFVFDIRPHDWMDPTILNALALYEGPYIKAVRDNPNEFVRDNFLLFNFLRQRGERASGADQQSVNT